MFLPWDCRPAAKYQLVSQRKRSFAQQYADRFLQIYSRSTLFFEDGILPLRSGGETLRRSLGRRSSAALLLWATIRFALSSGPNHLRPTSCHSRDVNKKNRGEMFLSLRDGNSFCWSDWVWLTFDRHRRGSDDPVSRVWA